MPGIAPGSAPLVVPPPSPTELLHPRLSACSTDISASSRSVRERRDGVAEVPISKRGRFTTGGEFILTEQRPRMQSRASVVPLSRGDAVIFAVRERPVQGTRGTYRVTMRHGVSALRSGRRHTLGVIFHDAK